MKPISLGVRRAAAQPWLWSFLAAVAVWAVTVAHAGGQGAGALLTAALTFSVFFVLVGIGQMFVIASGPGNVDLSIPSNIALSGAVAMQVMHGADAMILPGLLAACATGVVIGVGNAALIRLLSIPPIIATLSMSFIVQSVAIHYGRGLLVTPPPLLEAITTVRVGGVPVLAIAGLVLTAAMAVVLHRTLYGRSVLAIGQNPRAAWLAGIAVGRTRLATYALCAVFAALCGVLLAGFSGGAGLDLGESYLLSSIAVVVVGGTSVAGGRANLTGLWGAALFLYLLVAMLNSLGVGTGTRLVLNGLIIIAVIVLAGGEARTGR